MVIERAGVDPRKSANILTGASATLDLLVNLIIGVLGVENLDTVSTSAETRTRVVISLRNKIKQNRPRLITLPSTIRHN